MTDNELNNMEGMEEDEDLIVFEDDEGNEFTFRVEDYFFYNGEEYALLSDADSEACEGCEGDCDNCEAEEPLGCIVCKIEISTDENGEDTEEFVPVEDTELAEKLFNIADKKLSAEEEEDDE